MNSHLSCGLEDEFQIIFVVACCLSSQITSHTVFSGCQAAGKHLLPQYPHTSKCKNWHLLSEVPDGWLLLIAYDIFLKLELYGRFSYRRRVICFQLICDGLTISTHAFCCINFCPGYIWLLRWKFFNYLSFVFSLNYLSDYSRNLLRWLDTIILLKMITICFEFIMFSLDIWLKFREFSFMYYNSSRNLLAVNSFLMNILKIYFLGFVKVSNMSFQFCACFCYHNCFVLLQSFSQKFFTFFLTLLSHLFLLFLVPHVSL